MLGNIALTVYRDTDTQTTVKGVPVDDVRDELTIFGSVQPVTPDEIVEDGVGADRGKGTIKIYTKTRLIPLNEAEQKRPDQIAYQGKLYEVRSVMDYSMDSRLAHFKAVAVLIDAELE